jgi:hypothetical protein
MRCAAAAALEVHREPCATVNLFYRQAMQKLKEDDFGGRTRPAVLVR